MRETGVCGRKDRGRPGLRVGHAFRVCNENVVHPESDLLIPAPQLLPVCDTLVGQANPLKKSEL